MPVMKLVALFLICLLLVSCGGRTSSNETTKNDPTPTATIRLPDISAMVKRMITQDGCQDFTAEMRMTSEDGKGKRDQVDFKIQRKYSADRVSTFLTVLSPHEETDKAFLAIEMADQPTLAYSFLAGLNRLTKLNSDRQLGFRGAKVTVQELLGLELGHYTHDAGERVDEGGRQLIKAEFKQNPDLFLAYPRITGFFRESDQQPVRFDLFGIRDEIEKTVNFEEVKEIQNRMTITRVAIDDIQQKLKLKLETRKIDYDRGLSDSIFTENNLKNFISGASRKLDQTR